MQIEMNAQDILKVKVMLAGVKNGAQKVLKRAVDKTMGTIKTTVSREARKELNVYKRDLDKNIGVRKYDYAKAAGAVTIIGAALPIRDFKPVQVSTGVQVRIKKKGAAKTIKGAFIATMKAGNKGVTHTGVFWREWHGSRKPIGKRKLPFKKFDPKYRLQIHELFTTSLPEAVGNNLPMAAILSDASVNLHKNIEHQLDYELSKL